MERLFNLAFPGASAKAPIPQSSTPLIEARAITPYNIPELLQDRYDPYKSPEENVINAVQGKFFPIDFPIFFDHFTFSLPDNTPVNTPVVPANVTLRTNNKILNGMLAICNGQIILAGKSVVYLCGSNTTAIISMPGGTVMEAVEGTTTRVNTDDAQVFSYANIHANVNTLMNRIGGGDLAAMYSFGSMGISRLFPTLCSFDFSIKCLESAARSGCIKSMCLLGSLYFAGEQIEQNLHIAAGYFHEAHLRGDLNATFMLGEIYSSATFATCQFNTAKGSRSGAATGFEYYQEAAAKNHPQAQEKVNSYNSRLFNFNVYAGTKI